MSYVVYILILNKVIVPRTHVRSNSYLKVVLFHSQVGSTGHIKHAFERSSFAHQLSLFDRGSVAILYWRHVVFPTGNWEN